MTTHRVVAKMSNTSCTLRTRKFMTNRLLSRRQFVSARFPASHPGRLLALFSIRVFSGDFNLGETRRTKRGLDD